MSENNKEQEEYEKRLRRRLRIFKEEMEKGNIKLLKDSQLVKSLLKVKYNKNGEVDLNTVDGAVKSAALAITSHHDREEAKGIIGLIEIQERYFHIIELNFGHYYDIMLKNNLSPHNLAYYISNSKFENEVDSLDKNISKFINLIEEFWEAYADIAYYHLEDMHNSIKGVFGGDLFPSNNENIASKCGIYMDTIILPDPFMRSKNLFNIWKKKDRVYYLIKHALNILQYKILAITQLDFPIVVVIPDKEAMNENDFNFVLKMSESDALYHANKIFETNFQTRDELLDFAQRLDTIPKVIKEVKNPNRVLFNYGDNDPLENQIVKYLESNVSEGFPTKNPGIIVASTSFGRMGVCMELLLKARKFNGTPIIDAPTSWEYFKWKLEYDSERSNPYEDVTNLQIVRALNNFQNTSLQWIGKIPPEGLIELRKSGAINDIREIILKGINEINEVDKLDFNSTSNQVFENLNNAFRQHEKNINDLKIKKWKFAGQDIGSWLVSGAIEMAAAFTGHPLYGVSTFILNQFIDPPKLKDIPKKVKEIKKENLELKKSSVGMLFKYKF